jgi:DDE superfamily endonuclease
MDNPPSHKISGVREATEARGASLIYLPPYSPDLNPIGQAFAKLKALLRKAAPRTVGALRTVIGESLSAYSPGECANYLRRRRVAVSLKVLQERSKLYENVVRRKNTG